jgi:hypothetical protein
VPVEDGDPEFRRLEGELQTLLADAGFTATAFSPHRYDTFSDAPSASSAASLVTQGVDIRALKRA